MSAILPFHFEDHPVRVSECDGETWFVAADVCQALNIAKHRDAVARLDDDETGSVVVDTPGGPQQMAAVNESGVYSLIFRSRKAGARRFKRWVTRDVLPAIRRTGQFGGGIPVAALQDPAAMRALLLAYCDQVIQVESANVQLTEKATALDRLADAQGSLCVTDAAKALGVQPKRLFHWLMAEDWIYRRAPGAPYTAYQRRIETGLLEVKITRLTRTDGPAKLAEQVLVTPKGLTRLAELMHVQVTA